MDHLNKIVDQLLGYARSTEPTFELVDVNELLDDVLLLVRQRLGQQKIALVRKLTESLPKVRADHGQIEQACLNLILNAADAMPHGGTLTVSSAIQREPVARVALTFTDTGPGMPLEKRRQVFEPFFTTKARGTGLGLAIVQKIVEAHRGKIEVKSSPNKGTTFRLLLTA